MNARTNSMTRVLQGEEAQVAFGAAIARQIDGPLLIFLEGDLGAGKTTLTRGLLRGLGHTGAVKSPTYTLIEPYDLVVRPLYHLDLYRVGDPGELEYLGLREMLAEDAILVVEWPARGAGWLPQPDLEIRIEHQGDARALSLTGYGERGLRLLAGLSTNLQ